MSVFTTAGWEDLVLRNELLGTLFCFPLPLLFSLAQSNKLMQTVKFHSGKMMSEAQEALERCEILVTDWKGYL